MRKQGPEDAAPLFGAWKARHGRIYASEEEEARRFEVFEDNARLVAAHNAKADATFSMELNQFADSTW